MKKLIPVLRVTAQHLRLRAKYVVPNVMQFLGMVAILAAIDTIWGQKVMLFVAGVVLVSLGYLYERG